MDDIKFYDAYGSELHIGDAVRAVPDAPAMYWINGLEYGTVTRLYKDLTAQLSCYIDMKSFQGSVRPDRYGIHPVDCKYVIKIDDRCDIVTPSSSLLDCLDHI